MAHCAQLPKSDPFSSLLYYHRRDRATAATCPQRVAALARRQMLPPSISRGRKLLPLMPDPSIPPTDGTCLFFKISGEIRNRIYELAFTEANGLICYKHPSYPKVAAKLYPFDGQAEPIDGSIAVNQLQFASEQCRNETDWLEHNYNRLHFITDLTEEVGAIGKLAHYIRTVEEHCHRDRSVLWTNGIVLRDDDLATFNQLWYDGMILRTYPDEDWHKVLAFARGHPAVQINVRIPWIRPNRQSCVSLAIINSLIILTRDRDVHLPVPLPSNCHYWKEYMVWDIIYRDNLDFWRNLPTNIRLWPAHDAFDRDAFQATCGTCLRQHAHVGDVLANMMAEYYRIGF